MKGQEASLEMMTLDAWNRYQSVPPLVREDVLTDPETLALVAEARKLYGDDLEGIVLHGKWVEGEAAQNSPLELLLVMRRDTMPSDSVLRDHEYAERALAWEDLNLSWHGRETEPEVVIMPEKPHRCEFWHRVANGKGIVLDDPRRLIQNRLAELLEPPVPAM